MSFLRPSSRVRNSEGTRARRLGTRGVAIALAAALLASSALLSAPSAAVADVSPDEQWLTGATGASTAPATLSFGASAVTATLSAASNRCGSTTNVVPNTTLVSRNAQSYYSPQAPSTAVGVTECLIGTGLNVRTVTLNKPILGLTLHVNNLDASYVDIVQQFPGGYRLDKVKSNVSLQLQNSGTRIRNAVPMGTATCSDDAAATNNPGCGSFRLSQNDGPVSRFTFRNTPVGAGNDGWYWSLSFHEASLTKAFTPSTVTAGATSALSITVTNPGTEGAIPLSGVSFADSLPTGLTLADSAVTTTGCGAAAVNGGEPVAGQTSVDVTDATIAAGGTCVVTVNVTSAQPGTYTNNNSNITTSVGNIVPNADATLEVVPRAALGLQKRGFDPRRRQRQRHHRCRRHHPILLRPHQHRRRHPLGSGGQRPQGRRGGLSCIGAVCWCVTDMYRERALHGDAR